jgi:thiamine kinase-like enzyme
MSISARLTSSEPRDDMSRLSDVMALVPGMAGERWDATQLPGGLTNRNYRVMTSAGRQMVVRLSSAQSALLAIDRDAEFSNSTAAAAAGVAPEVIVYNPELGALVIDWIDGVTCSEADLDDSATLSLIAQTCHTLHNGPRFAGDFDMFDLQERYLELVLSRGFRLPPSYLEHMSTVATMREAMAVQDEGTVPCHNDLLAANIMRTGDRMWFIDYEYAGNSDPCFELGNIASESHLSDERLTELIAAYYGTATVGKVARAKLFALMSNYGWTLWAAIQDSTSDLDFDFWAWGMEKYERALQQLRDRGLPQLISDVQEP